MINFNSFLVSADRMYELTMSIPTNKAAFNLSDQVCFKAVLMYLKQQSRALPRDVTLDELSGAVTDAIYTVYGEPIPPSAVTFLTALVEDTIRLMKTVSV